LCRRRQWTDRCDAGAASGRPLSRSAVRRAGIPAQGSWQAAARLHTEKAAGRNLAALHPRERKRMALVRARRFCVRTGKARTQDRIFNEILSMEARRAARAAAESKMTAVVTNAALFLLES